MTIYEETARRLLGGDIKELKDTAAEHMEKLLGPCDPKDKEPRAQLYRLHKEAAMVLDTIEEQLEELEILGETIDKAQRDAWAV